MHTDVNEELVILTATERGLFSTISILHNVYHYNQIARNFKLLNLRPAVYILMQKAVILNARRIVGKVLA